MKTGKIEAVSQKEKGYSFKIGSDWFSGFGKAPAKKGDEVEFDFYENNGFKNITKTGVKVIKANTQTSENICRINVDAGNCLQRATELIIAGKGEDLTEVTKLCVKAYQEALNLLSGKQSEETEEDY